MISATKVELHQGQCLGLAGVFSISGRSFQHHSLDQVNAHGFFHAGKAIFRKRDRIFPSIVSKSGAWKCRENKKIQSSAQISEIISLFMVGSERAECIGGGICILS